MLTTAITKEILAKLDSTSVARGNVHEIKIPTPATLAKLHDMLQTAGAVRV